MSLPASGSRLAEPHPTTFLFLAMILSWIAFAHVGSGRRAHPDIRPDRFPAIQGRLGRGALDTLTAVNCWSGHLVHFGIATSIPNRHMARTLHRPALLLLPLLAFHLPRCSRW